MFRLHPTIDPETLPQTVAAARRRLLMLDYDGCIAPFHVLRDRAYPYPGIMPLLSRLRLDERNAVVIITGRSAEEMPALLGTEHLPEIWGAHGWERRYPDGRIDHPHIPQHAEAMLEEAATLLATEGWEPQLDRKVASLAVHWRGLPPATVAMLEHCIHRIRLDIDPDEEFDVRNFDGGVEFRIPGRDKGTVVRSLIDEHPDASFIVYLGDDETDEDAFRALDGRGLRVLVRSELRPTCADLHLVPPGELLEFLAMLDTP